MSGYTKPRIILPKNPTTYYGSTLNIEDADVGIKLYIGEYNRVEEMIVESVNFDEKLNSYEVHTNKAILLAFPFTRVAYSTNYKR